MAIGVGFGASLWIDLDATRLPEFRWITLACLFAMSAGVVSGFSGVNRLGNLLSLPLWAGAVSALLATGQWIAAIAGTVFAAITMRDMTDNGERWTELLERRIESNHNAEAHLWQATHDALTGLTNRAGIIAQLDERVATAKVRGPLTRVMFIDLDHFKEVNDRYGHAAGDTVLVTVGERLQRVLRSDDLVGRLGGDEFCVICCNDHDNDSAAAMARRIIVELEKPISGPWGDDVYISASIGMSRVESARAKPQQILLEADCALYEAKRTGRRRVIHFDHELESKISERAGLESQLRRAVRNGDITAAAQPIFDLSTGAVANVELLARWELRPGTMVPPSVFIPIAEQVGIVGDLTQQMLHLAGRQLAEWADHEVLGDAQVSVNVSATEFQRDDIVHRVADAVAIHSIPAGRLVLELTESHQLDATTGDLAQFEALRALGVRCAIDDFGSGYSSLDHLLSLPVEVIKLDRNLIANIGSDPREQSLIRAVHGVARGGRARRRCRRHRDRRTAPHHQGDRGSFRTGLLPLPPGACRRAGRPPHIGGPSVHHCGG